MTRRTIHPAQLAAESGAIIQFVFDCVEPHDGHRMPIAEVFEHYQAWRDSNKLPLTQLHIDGFGRLFPRVFPRKSAYWSESKGSLKCVLNARLKGGFEWPRN